MKKTVATILIAACCFTIAAALADGMTDVQTDQYLQQFLSVSERTVYSHKMARGEYYSIDIRTSSSVWTPYQGYRQIKKSEFFHIAGRDDISMLFREAEQRTAKVRKAGATLAATGGTLLGTGLIAMIVADSNGNQLVEDIGAGLAIAAVLPFYLGLELMDFETEPEISATFAIKVADIYNQKLAAEIKISY